MGQDLGLTVVRHCISNLQTIDRRKGQNCSPISQAPAKTRYVNHIGEDRAACEGFLRTCDPNPNSQPGVHNSEWNETKVLHTHSHGAVRLVTHRPRRRWRPGVIASPSW